MGYTLEDGAIRTSVRTRRGATAGVSLGLLCGIVAFVCAMAWLPRRWFFLPIDFALGLLVGRGVFLVLNALLSPERTFVLARSGVRIGDRQLTFEEALPLLATQKSILSYDLRELLEVTAARVKAKRAWIPLEDLRALQAILPRRRASRQPRGGGLGPRRPEREARQRRPERDADHHERQGVARHARGRP